MTDQLNLKGKSVALVGPAKPVGDQSAEVEACDFIIRCDYRWNGHNPLVGYGERIDAAFYSLMGAKEANNHPEFWQDIPWVLLKHGSVPMNHPRTINLLPPIHSANQMPYLAKWLETMGPREIHIFGADFYTSGPEGFQQKGYTPEGQTLNQSWSSIKEHNQALNHQWMREFQDRTRLIKGDSRMVELLSLTTEEVVARLNEAWRGI